MVNSATHRDGACGILPRGNVSRRSGHVSTYFLSIVGSLFSHHHFVCFVLIGDTNWEICVRTAAGMQLRPDHRAEVRLAGTLARLLPDCFARCRAQESASKPTTEPTGILAAVIETTRRRFSPDCEGKFCGSRWSLGTSILVGSVLFHFCEIVHRRVQLTDASNIRRLLHALKHS